MSSPSKREEDSAAVLLTRAASNGDLPAVKALLVSGADVNSANSSGQTALMLAAVMGHAEVVATLVEAGADPRLRDRLSLTALEWSTRRGFSEVSQLLTKISPPLQHPTTAAKAASSKPNSETKSQPSITPNLNSKSSQVPEAVPTTSPASSDEQIQSERQELTSKPLPVEATRSPEKSPEPEKPVPVDEGISTTAAIIGNVKLPADRSHSTQPASVDVSTSPVVSTSPEKRPEPEKPVPVDEGISTTTAIIGNVKLPADRSHSTQPAPFDVSTSPEKRPEPEKPVPVDEGISRTAAISGNVKVPADRSHSTQPAPVDVSTSPVVSTSPEKPPEPEKPVPVDEGISRTAAISGNVKVPADRSPSTQPASVDVSTSPVISTSPEKPPESLPVVTGSAAKTAAEVAVESKPQVSVDSASVSKPGSEPQPADLQPQPQVSRSIPNSAAAESRKTEPEKPASSSKKANLEKDEDETLSKPPVPVSQRIETPPQPAAPATSSSAAANPRPLERMPWMPDRDRDREPAFKASPLALSATKPTEDSAFVSNLKRCPKCNTVYQNTLMSYCPRDSAALIRSDELHPVAVANSSTPVAVWLLIAFVLGASAFAAYRLTQYFYRTDTGAPAAATTTPTEAPAEVKNPFFTVGGSLAGMEVNVPEPEYPSELQSAGVAGPITVTIRVNKSGRVISAAASNGDRRLRSAAVKAARQATFAADKLAEVNPRSRVVSGSITYEFAPPATTAPPPAPSPADNTSATNTPNADPNAPVVSDSLLGAAIDVPAAEYPSRQRSAGIDGTITVTIRVSRNGRVISWRTSAGDSQLRAAAIRAARKASFSPEKLPGTGEVLGTITYKFTP